MLDYSKIDIRFRYTGQTINLVTLFNARDKLLICNTIITQVKETLMQKESPLIFPYIWQICQSVLGNNNKRDPNAKKKSANIKLIQFVYIYMHLGKDVS